ncbi:hypothetical protein F511_21247 [Dorcoceras hygrometricum]|uniref:Uncharacterized protein n=1 Tax=Dorcoceras hygrometricum TaxID=472368 RepID=A0A2Z7C8H2_9LAMI|nr:hypothetical protein F511_21247 [Dorcoceras hygrometricum]
MDSSGLQIQSFPFTISFSPFVNKPTNLELNPRVSYTEDAYEISVIFHKYATSEDLYIHDPLQVATRYGIKHCHHVSHVLSSNQISVSFQALFCTDIYVVIWVYGYSALWVTWCNHMASIP